MFHKGIVGIKESLTVLIIYHRHFVVTEWNLPAIKPMSEKVNSFSNKSAFLSVSCESYVSQCCKNFAQIMQMGLKSKK